MVKYKIACSVIVNPRERPTLKHADMNLCNKLANHFLSAHLTHKTSDYNNRAVYA